jgi:mono/diheme cytochrome c family protein
MIMEKLIRILQELNPPFIPKLWKAALWSLVVLALLVPTMVFLGLRVPQIEFLNGMAWQPKAKSQSISPVNGDGEPLFADGVTVRAPLKGTVPRGHQEYPWRIAVYGADEAKRLAGENLLNPLPPTLSNLKQGERVFDNYCQPCHGFKGIGDGSAVGLGRLEAPTSLHAAKVKNYADGEMFHIITEGQNKMPSYAWQLTPLKRWAAVHYVRVLQRAGAPLPGDLPSTGTLNVGGESKIELEKK